MKPEYDCPMHKKWSILLAFMMFSVAVYSQSNPVDTTIISKSTIDSLAIDSDFDYDLFRDFDAFMDSILSPHNYLLGSLSLGRGFFNFENKGSSLIETSKKLTYSPTLGYYHKSGFGLTTIGYIVDDDTKLNFYQFSVSPSFDYLQNHDIATGISYSRFFTKDSLPFYTSPLQNEVYAYFTYRKLWMRPSVAMSYGWGSRSDYQKREELLQSLRLRPRGYTYINTTESVSDFSIMTSLRHDFYWLDVFTYNDHIRFTPQLVFTSGTQKFGFNQTSNTYGTTIRTGANELYNSENLYLSDQLKFQPLSLTMFLRGEYTIGKFFIQPQVAFDYYFPSKSDNFSSLFSVNTGFIF
ncbi:MAG: hypothetical protein ABUT20_31800 [Bacteroidota bacterium]